MSHKPYRVSTLVEIFLFIYRRYCSPLLFVAVIRCRYSLPSFVAGENFRPVGDRASGRVNEFVRDVEPVWKVESVWNVDANDDKVSQLV